MPSKLRTDFIKVAALSLTAAFIYTDTAILVQGTQSAAKALMTTTPIAQPVETNTSPLPLLKTFAEVVAGTRDERDRVNAISDAIAIQRTAIGGSNRIAPTRS